MCGIAGLVGGFVPGLAREMGLRQNHRGPDGSGVFEDPSAGIALGHVRLAILDLTDAGAQPMSTPDGRYVLVTNGEIYNYKELRSGLIAKGERFVSTGDTEVLLRGLALEGEDFLLRLNGMFALALWDRRERELLLARDPLGVKPLYFVEPEPGSLLFASEIKALLAHPGVRRAPDFEALLQHLAFCHACGDRTAFAGIRRLRPGTLLRWGRSATFRRYWRAPFGEPAQASRGASVGHLRRILGEATSRQLVSDVPVGSFLSGGIDSTLVTALAGKEHLRCYTVTYPPSENLLDGAVEDAPYARRVARTLGLPHCEREIKPDVVTLLPKLIHHLDEPLADPAVIACYLVSEQARLDGRPVLLSGQGADELFAGYPRYRAMLMTRWAGFIPAGLRRRIAAAARALPGAKEGSGGATMRRARRLLSSLDADPDRRFLSYAASTPDAAIFEVLHPDVRAALGNRAPGDECLERMQSENLEGADRWLERDLSVYLPNHNLLYTDKVAMAVGLEVRVPLLDLALVEEVVRYPVEWKIRGRVTKALLREAASGIVPDEVIRRPKAGFGAPYRKWLRYDLKEMWDDLASDAVVRRRGWFNPAGLGAIRRRSQSQQEDLYMLQWAVLTIELWARTFLDA